VDGYAHRSAGLKWYQGRQVDRKGLGWGKHGPETWFRLLVDQCSAPPTAKGYAKALGTKTEAMLRI
jgi:hypothetical protein